MSILTNEQKHQLNMYSVYLTNPANPLFGMGKLMTEAADPLNVIQFISESPNQTVAASYFIRKWGMFISMQFYLLTSSSVVWDGKDRAVFGAVEEFGLRTISTFIRAEDFRLVAEEERQDVIHMILEEQCHDVINQLRKFASVSPLTLWENIFGYLIWHYHVFFTSSAHAKQAKSDWEILCNDDVWKGIADQSRFAIYTGGKEPSQLLNVPVRKSCCFSKDVPGLMKCTFCPLN